MFHHQFTLSLTRMKINTLEQNDILKAYNAYWEYYLHGDVTGLASMLDDHYTQIGSVEGEVFNNKTDAVNFVQSTIDQIAGKVDMRNRKITLETVEHSVLITELTDLYILIDGEWNFYAKFRASSLMQKKGDKWKFIHQHSSMPDIRAEEGDNIATEKIAKENLELRDAVKRRTIELEQKNSELAMEAALERVRSVAMGMRKLDELPAICEVLYNELQQMGFSELRNAMINIHNDENGSFVNYDFSDEIGRSINHLNYNIHPVLEKQFKEIRSTHDAFSETVYKGKDLDDWRAFRKKIGEKDDPRIDQTEALYYYFYSIGTGSIGISTFSAITEEKLQQLKRFRNVFDFAYRRYTDVAQAEERAREAQIVAALERVRSRSMAMHNSEELLQVITVVSEQLQQLHFKFNTVSFAINNQEHDYRFWFAVLGNPAPVYIQIPYIKNPMFDRVKAVLAKGTGFYTDTLTPDESRQWHEHVFANADFSFLTEETKSYILRSGYARSVAITPGIMLIISNYAGKPYTDAENEIIKRFATVFEQSYTRFLDLQKAETQAREAQIEAALERVRSKTMAMHDSKDVGDTVATMFDEFVKLGIVTNRCGILIFGNPRSTEVWTAKESQDAGVSLIIGHLDTTIHPMLTGVYQAWQGKEKTYSYELAGEDIKNYYSAINNARDYPTRFDTGLLPEREIHSDFFFAEGAVFAFTPEVISEDASKILKRFAGVFGQTYRRYLDLQKAEAQAREATIEAALERVRGKAMAMHNSSDLTATASMVFTELRKLGINPIRCGVGLLNKESRKILLYSAASSEDGDNLLFSGWVVLDGHPVLSEIYNCWTRNEDYFPVLKGELLRTYYEMIRSSFRVPEEHSGYEQQGYFLAFSEGTFYGWMEKPLTDAEVKILGRFKVIIDLTFRRYMELQKSEANALEAVRRASLDRVRAEIASMRTISDLDRITPLIWSELTILGVPFIRCGVFIMDEGPGLIHTFLSTPEGKALASFHLPFDVSHDMKQIVVHWRDKARYQQHWDEEAFLGWTKTLMDLHAIPSSESYTTEHLPKNLYLNFLPFRQGMLYVGNEEPLQENDLQVVQNLADAFSTAYARYEDFKKLEEAKEQVDKTLTHLKQTQAQLVQAEKMASLGELTAGIAHEIQNPLNFVNNFSDINHELSDEIIEAAKRGDITEIQLLAADIKANQEKISEHGRRADGIVKGMLQHSRSSSGVMEPTDINKLADEYLRLAYHGLRAKDKSFNSALLTDFDASIGMIPVTPQDIGRVLLNLYNNAFYAVAEKKKLYSGDYEPEVFVSTRKNGTRVEIMVKDNGMGIPEKVKDKIFQPFYTTKPTGQGTGLGLSLSYDIIKAHNGAFSVESLEGQGASFTMSLPIK